MSLKEKLTEDMKAAMRAGEKERLLVIRTMNAAIKQREVDERIVLDDTQVIAVLEKAVKQRKDSIAQFDAAGRTDLSSVERAELAVIESYLPTKMDAAAIAVLVDVAINESGATSAKDMGKVMAVAKQKAAGLADMGLVSELIKQKLAALS